MAHERPRERHQPAADPPDVHEEARQDEERHREHRERVHPGDDLLRDEDEREVGRHDGDGGGGGEGEADGDRRRHQCAEDAEQQAAHQPASPAESSPPVRPASRWITISAPETGAAA